MKSLCLILFLAIRRPEVTHDNKSNVTYYERSSSASDGVPVFATHHTLLGGLFYYFILFLGGSRCAVHGGKNALRSKGFVSRCLTNEKPYCEMRSVMFPAGL